MKHLAPNIGMVLFYNLTKFEAPSYDSFRDILKKIK